MRHLITLASLMLLMATSTPAALLLLDVQGASLISTDATQTGRILRNGTASTWASAKPFPGFNDNVGVRHYKTYSVSVPGYGSPVYYELTLTANTTLFFLAYTGSFNSGSLASNYLGDPGSSNATSTFRVMLPDGDTPLSIVVHEVNANGGLNVAYNLTVNAYADANLGEIQLPSSVPEPGSLTLAALAGGLLMAGRWRRA